MSFTLTIPLTTLTVGAHDFGPYTVQPADNQVTLTVDRTVTGGLDATPSTEIDITVNKSADGVSWALFISGHVLGGIQTFTDKQGVVHQYTASLVGARLDQVHGDILKATVTVQNVPVAVAGSLAIT